MASEVARGAIVRHRPVTRRGFQSGTVRLDVLSPGLQDRAAAFTSSALHEVEAFRADAVAVHPAEQLHVPERDAGALFLREVDEDAADELAVYDDDPGDLLGVFIRSEVGQ